MSNADLACGLPCAVSVQQLAALVYWIDNRQRDPAVEEELLEDRLSINDRLHSIAQPHRQR